jgi:hypothetical protein
MASVRMTDTKRSEGPVLTESAAKAPARIKKPPVLFRQTQEIIREIENELQSTFIAYWNSPSGNVCQDDVIVINEIFRHLGPKKHVTVFIKSDGGTGKASLRMTHLLRHYASSVTAAVPLNCSSAATMIALGADEIHMGPMAYLTAVDTSLTHDLSPIDKDNSRVSVSQDELSRIINGWRKESKSSDANPYQALFQYVHPLVIGAVDRASSLSIKLCQEILSYHMKNEKRAAAISHHLNANYPSHSYPITIREAKRIGLNVKPLAPKLDSLLIKLHQVYSEMGQKAVTDFDERNHHDNEIVSLLEARDIQVHYQVDKDWHYRQEERRWVSLNDQSSWRRIVADGKKFKSSMLHIR